MSSKNITIDNENSPTTEPTNDSTAEQKMPENLTAPEAKESAPSVLGSSRDASSTIVAKSKTKAAAKKSVAKRTVKLDAKPDVKAGNDAAMESPAELGRDEAVKTATKIHGSESHGIALVPPVTVGTDASDPIREATSHQQIEAAIRWRAYELYLERDGRCGSAFHDWAAAEKDIRSRFLQRRA